MTHLSAVDYQVIPVLHAEARALVSVLHYSGSAANTSVFAHGLVDLRAPDCPLVGAALWMPLKL